jgi:ABC-2 type transport system permease protein
VTLQERDVPQTGSAEYPPPPRVGLLKSISSYIAKISAVTEIELRKMSRDPIEPLTRAVQPALWLLIFGQVFTRIRAIPTGGVPYLEYMVGGILAQSVLFIAIFSGMMIIWERDLGTSHKLIVSPTPRSAIVLGKAFSCGMRTMPQVLFIYILCAFLHAHLKMDPLSIIGVVVTVFLSSTLFSTMSLLIACLAKFRERFMGIGQLLTMPLFFASNALYPISMMPDWLQVLSHVNPLSYSVDALRYFTIGQSAFSFTLDWTVLLCVSFVLVLICARVYQRIAA